MSNFKGLQEKSKADQKAFRKGLDEKRFIVK